MKLTILVLFFVLLLTGCKLKTNTDLPDHSYNKYMASGYLVYTIQDTTDTGKITKCTLWGGSLSCVVIGEIK